MSEEGLMISKFQSAGISTIRPVQSRLLIPLTAVLLILIGGFSAVMLRMHHDTLTQSSREKLAATTYDLDAFVANRTTILSGLEDVLLQDAGLIDALKAQDRDGLLADWQVPFSELRAEYGITHFYFHLPDRVNLLRVHDPEKSGDLIDRFTAREAERTGQMSSGCELGPLGTFTLRVVRPVYDGETLIGYVELGQELEDILDDICDEHGVELAAVIHKQALNRDGWEAGMAILGREANWDGFDGEAMIYSSLNPIPAEVEVILGEGPTQGAATIESWFGEEAWQVMVTPLIDVSGTDVGNLIVINGIAPETAAFRRLMVRSAGAAMVLLAALLGFLYVLLRRTDKSIARQQVELAERETRFRTIYESTGDAIMMLDKKGFFACNKASLSMFGVASEEEFCTKHPADLSPATQSDGNESMAAANEQVEKAMREGSNRFEWTHRRDDTGKPFSAEVLLTAMELSGRQVLQATVRNITRRKRAEQNAHDLAQIVEKSLNEIYIFDAETFKFIQVNRGARDNIGYTDEELTELTPLDIKPEFTQERFVQLVEPLRNRSEEIARFDTVHQRKDGSRYDVEVHLQLSELNGRPAFVAIILDVTERKTAEAIVRESNERLDQLAEQSRTFAWEVDANGLYTYVSEIALKVIGYKAKELVGRMHFYDLHPEAGREELKAAASEMFAGRARITSLENAIQAKNGETVWVSTYGLPMENADGTLRGYRGSDIDITGRKRAERERENLLLAMNKRVKELQCNYRISESIQTKTTLEEICQDVADLIPSGWQYSDIAMGQVTLDGEVYTSGPFKETKWHQTSEIVVNGEPRGSVDVFYMKECPELDEGPFMSEERNLLDAIAGCIGRVVRNKQADEELRRSEAFQRILSESSPDFVFVLNIDGIIQSVNRTHPGRNKENLIGEEASRSIRPECRQEFEAAFRQALNTGKLQTLETEIDLPDGRHYFLNRLNPVFLTDEEGFVILFSTDITDRKRAEQALRENEERLRTIIEANKDAMIVLDNRGTVTLFNSAAETTFGHRAEDMLGQPVANLMPESFRPQHTKASPDCFAKGTPDNLIGKTVEVQAVRANGEKFPIEISLAKGGSGERAFVVSVIRDITERKLAEEALREFKVAVEQSADGIALADLEGRIRWVNRAWAEMHDYSVEELVGQQFSVFHTGEQMRTDVAPFREHLLESGSNEGEIGHVRKDRTIFPAWRTCTVLRAVDGAPFGVLSMVRDITEQKQAREELEAINAHLEQQTALMAAMAAEAESASAAKSEFLANMSHEIRTPMNAIIGLTELVLGGELKDQQREFLGMVGQSAENLMSIINDVLDFSKIEAGQLTLEKIDFNLRDVAETALTSLSLKAKENDLDLVCFVDPLVPDYLSGDPTRLRQVIINLLGNSIKFTEEGEIVLRVELESGAPEPHIHFSISDTGIGIPKDRIARIFDSFTQADGSTTRKYGGTGLGTTISKQLVEKMDGSIWIISPTNETGVGGPGTTFHFTIPISLAASQPPAQKSTSGNMAGQHVLIVDDNESNRRLLTALAESWDIYPTSVSSGKQALQAIASEPDGGPKFSLILLDNFMPGMDGLELAKILRSDPRHNNIRIILLSSTGESFDRDALKKLGIYSFVSKPLRQAAVFDAITDAIGSPTGGFEGQSQVVETEGVPEHLDRFGESKRVLLVEDNKFNMVLAKKLLEKKGFEVETATDGKQAVEAVRSTSYDLIFMDVQMPIMNGFEATAEIRRLQRLTGEYTLIIAMTANAMDRDREKCLEVGMDDYISKPIDPKRLSECVVKHLTCEFSPDQIRAEVRERESYEF